jgi:hypothetical protein
MYKCLPTFMIIYFMLPEFIKRPKTTVYRTYLGISMTGIRELFDSIG